MPQYTTPGGALRFNVEDGQEPTVRFINVYWDLLLVEQPRLVWSTASVLVRLSFYSTAHMASRTPEILFSDDDIVVVVKPAGIHSVPLIGKKTNELTIASFLVRELPGQATLPAPDHGLIQRLDRETSGILVAAKSKKIMERLRANYKAGDFKKEYLVLIDGALARTIQSSSPLGGRYRSSKKVSPHVPRAQPAASVIEPIRIFGDRATFCKVTTATGVRHQVRAHCAELGYPLLGDELYGSRRPLAEVISDYPSHFLLHANVISFSHPGTGERVTYEVQIPFEILGAATTS